MKQTQLLVHSKLWSLAILITYLQSFYFLHHLSFSFFVITDNNILKPEHHSFWFFCKLCVHIRDMMLEGNIFILEPLLDLSKRYRLTLPCIKEMGNKFNSYAIQRAISTLTHWGLRWNNIYRWFDPFACLWCYTERKKLSWMLATQILNLCQLYQEIVKKHTDPMAGNCFYIILNKTQSTSLASTVSAVAC